MSCSETKDVVKAFYKHSMVNAYSRVKALNAFNEDAIKKDLPQYDVKRDLTRLGLISNGSPLLRRYQLGWLIFQWLMVLHWLVLLGYGESEYSAYLADFTGVLGGSRVYTLIPLIVWTLLDAIFRALYWFVDKLDWIETFDVIKGKPTKLLNDKLVLKFWRRCIQILFFKRVMVSFSIGFAVLMQMLPLMMNNDDVVSVSFGVGWGILRLISTASMLTMIIGTACYGYLIFHYYSLRFSTISDEAAVLAMIDGHCLRIGTFRKLNEKFNIICTHLYTANRFWKHVLTSMYFGFTGCSCLLIFQLTFLELSKVVYSAFVTLLFCNVSCQMIMFISAAYVAGQVSYRPPPQLLMNIL